ncbi:hypothetical protein BY458DRAFT_554592 [Sporodiniella umbellata]|nr:hypothetical protein BY458DRAFT_554592 [Sporodiniella umbellata]
MEWNQTSIVAILLVVVFFLLVGILLLLKNRKEASPTSLLDPLPQEIIMSQPLRMYEKALLKEDAHFHTIPLDTPSTPIHDRKRASKNERSLFYTPFSKQAPSYSRSNSLLLTKESLVHPPAYQQYIV